MKQKKHIYINHLGFTMIEVVMFIVIVGIALAGTLSVLNLTNRHSADPIVQKEALSIAEGLMQEILNKYAIECDADDPYSRFTAIVQQNEVVNKTAIPSDIGGIKKLSDKCLTTTSGKDSNGINYLRNLDVSGTPAKPDGGNIDEDASENRFSVTSPFDEVKDYNGVHYLSYEDITNKGVEQVGLTSYQVDVSVGRFLKNASNKCEWNGMGGSSYSPASNGECYWLGINGKDVYKIKVSVSLNGEASLGVSLEGYRTKFEPVIIDRKFTDQELQKCFTFTKKKDDVTGIEYYINTPQCQ